MAELCGSALWVMQSFALNRWANFGRIPFPRPITQIPAELVVIP
jgi:hypothetical protein